MAGMNNSVNELAAGDFGDAAIRDFLLTKIPPANRSAFEHRLLSDEKFAQRVQLGELQLCDDYACGRLSRRSRKLFEDHFLVTADRNRQLQISRVLSDRLRPSRRQRLQRLLAEGIKPALNVRQPLWRWTFAALLFLLLGATGWLVVKKEPQIKEEITKRIRRSHASVQPTPAEANHPVNASTPQHQASSSPRLEHDGSNESPQPVYLNPVQTAGSAASLSIKVPENQPAVHFELGMANRGAAEYQAEVVTMQGQTIFKAAVTAKDEKVGVEVPAGLLTQGKFKIRLRDRGSKHALATYLFEVQ